MLYKIGTVDGLEVVWEQLAPAIRSTVQQLAAMLDREYGSGRNIDRDDGGYILIAENVQDIQEIICNHIDLTRIEPEQITVVQGSNPVWLDALFLLNNEFGVSVLFPLLALGKVRGELEGKGSCKSCLDRPITPKRRNRKICPTCPNRPNSERKQVGAVGQLGSWDKN